MATNTQFIPWKGGTLAIGLSETTEKNPYDGTRYLARDQVQAIAMSMQLLRWATVADDAIKKAMKPEKKD